MHSCLFPCTNTYINHEVAIYKKKLKEQPNFPLMLNRTSNWAFTNYFYNLFNFMDKLKVLDVCHYSLNYLLHVSPNINKRDIMSYLLHVLQILINFHLRNTVLYTGKFPLKRVQITPQLSP